MLCPEVLNFKAPESFIDIQKLSNVQVVKKIQSFPFPHLVTLTVPDILKVPESITKIFAINSRYYKVSNFALGDLVNRAFISCFVKKGSLSLLSVGTRIDCDNCVALTPEGYLILNLDKQTFQSLGLEGKPSHFHSKTKDRFVVTIDLNQQCLKPGKTIFERTKANLNKLGRFTVILKWEPPIMDQEICPSSIAKYFADLNYDVSYSDLVHNINTAYSVKVPHLDFESCDNDDIIAFSEWLGMVSINCDLDGSPDNYLSSYEVPEPHSVIGQVKILQWRGLFSSRQIKAFFEAVSNFVSLERKAWTSVYVQGFSDAAVGWNNEEHHYYTNGDNSFLLIFDKDNCVMCTQGTSRKKYK